MLALPFEIFFSFWSCQKTLSDMHSASKIISVTQQRDWERHATIFHALPAAQSILFSNQLLSLWIRLHWWQNWLSGSEHCLHFVDSQRWKKLHKLRCVLSLSLSLPPPQTHNRCKQARWEWVHVWFGCCHGLFSPVRDAASIIVILPRSLPLPTQPSWQQFLPLSQRRGGTSLPLAGCPPGNFFSCKLQMFLLLWQWVDSRLRERNCRLWRIQRPLHFQQEQTDCTHKRR